MRIGFIGQGSHTTDPAGPAAALVCLAEAFRHLGHETWRVSITDPYWWAAVSSDPTDLLICAGVPISRIPRALVNDCGCVICWNLAAIPAEDESPVAFDGFAVTSPDEERALRETGVAVRLIPRPEQSGAFHEAALEFLALREELVPHGRTRSRGAAEAHYRCGPVHRLPLGELGELAYSATTRQAIIVSKQTGERLAGWGNFATPEDHAIRLEGQTLSGAAEIRAAAAQMQAIADSGLVVSRAEVLRRCRLEPRPQSEAPRIGSIGIPTRNRLPILRRCLVSYFENQARHGRAADYVIIDDSEDAQVRQLTREMLCELAGLHGVRIQYGGLEERLSYAEALVRQGLPADAVEFALFNVEKCPIATGACRNAMLLDQAGELFLSVDDDTICLSAPPPKIYEEARLTSVYDPTEYWFFADNAAVRSALRFQDEDVLGIHERLLGRDVADAVNSFGGASSLNIDGLEWSTIQRLEKHEGKVTTTLMGVAGDSTLGSSRHFFGLAGASHQRLIHSEEVYRGALLNRQVIRAVTRATINAGTYCSSMNLGFDFRTLLPPFMPVQRNQDGLFAQTLRACFPENYVGLLPRVLLHAPPVPRTHTMEELWESVSGFRSYDIVRLLIMNFAVTHPHLDARHRLTRLGEHLLAAGTMPRAEFEEAIRLAWWNTITPRLPFYEKSLQESPEWPEYWRADFRRYIDLLREALPRKEYLAPRDLVRIFGHDGSIELCRKLVRRFGELLCAWPAIVDAALYLRWQGRRLSRPLC